MGVATRRVFLVDMQGTNSPWSLSVGQTTLSWQSNYWLAHVHKYILLMEPEWLQMNGFMYATLDYVATGKTKHQIPLTPILEYIQAG